MYFFFFLLRELFLKTNAQLTIRCRQLLSELSYIYPIDLVSFKFLKGVGGGKDDNSRNILSEKVITVCAPSLVIQETFKS